MIFIPLPDGTYTQVAVEESPYGADLAAQYPTIKTFTFDGVEDTNIRSHNVGRRQLSGDSAAAG